MASYTDSFSFALPEPFQFILHSHPTILRYMKMWTTESVAKWVTNKYLVEVSRYAVFLSSCRIQTKHSATSSVPKQRVQNKIPRPSSLQEVLWHRGHSNTVQYGITATPPWYCDVARSNLHHTIPLFMSLGYSLFIKLVWNSFFFWYKGCQFLITGNLFTISYTNHRPHLFGSLKRRNFRIGHMKLRSKPVSFHSRETWYFLCPKNINYEFDLKFVTN